jgi:hypothetical protein
MAERDRTKPAAAPCRLREWRQAEGLTLRDVSDLTGRDIAQLSRLERGQGGLRPLAQVDFARRLGVRVKQIFGVRP